MYGGDLATVSDLSQASPVQCTVPAGRPPVPGEQLTVPDTLPDPGVGAGRYYLAAVRHGAQIRAGRSSMGRHDAGKACGGAGGWYARAKWTTRKRQRC